MNFKKIVAVAVAAALAVGNGAVALADSGGVTSQGTLEKHINKKVYSVTLPTASNDTFRFWIDPERLVNSSGVLVKEWGTSASDAVTPNNDGVYFANSGGTYTSHSDTLKFIGNNSEAVDVTLTAKFGTATSAGVTITDSAGALGSATTPTLLMTMDVGDSSGIVIKPGTEGTSKTVTLDGSPNNFQITGSAGTAKYEYGLKPGISTSDGTAWETTTLTIKGQVNEAEVSSTNTGVPALSLTWSVEEHVDAYASASSISAAAPSVTLSLPASVTVTGCTLYVTGNATGTNMQANTHYFISGTTLSFLSRHLTAWGSGRIVVNYSDGHSDTLTF